MHERELNLREALAHIDERWDERRVKQGVERAQRTLVRRRLRAQLAGAGGAIVTMSCLALIVFRSEAPRTAAVSSQPTAASASADVGDAAATRASVAAADARRDDASSAVHASGSGVVGADSGEVRRIQLSDGSQIALLSAESRVIVRKDGRARAELELVRGRARFDVVPRPTRVFRVHSAGVNVQVLGTVFEVERTARQTLVSVTRGRVAVSWRGGRRELGASEAGAFPPAPPSAADVAHADRSADSPSARALQAASPAVESGEPASAAGWREPAARGEYARAYALLQQPGPAPLTVAELLLAADAARLSGHPDAALPYLQRVIDDHPQDSRASLAAFTLGGVLMQQLARPREAEAAYAKARALAVHSSLAQDALARQVEAAHLAGDAAYARKLADEYIERYPDGRRVHAVRRFGGLREQ